MYLFVISRRATLTASFDVLRQSSDHFEFGKRRLIDRPNAIVDEVGGH
jgi:hypothetical protein